MSTNNKQKEFFEEVKEKMDDDKSFTDDSERALLLLLLDEESNIFILDDDPGWLHKAFRQIDVTDSGKRDMAIWHLLNNSKVVWEIIENIYKDPFGNYA